MCKLCKNIVSNKEGYYDAICKGEDFIFEDEGEFYLRIDTGDSWCPGIAKINYCPICGRKLVDD